MRIVNTAIGVVLLLGLTTGQPIQGAGGDPKPGTGTDKATSRILLVATPELPRHFSPLRARSNEEKAARDLLFSSLTSQTWGKRGKDLLRLDLGELCRVLPWPRERKLLIELHEGLTWSDGRAITSADMRHTYNLLKTTLASRHPLVRELVDKPHLSDSPLRYEVVMLRPMFDPLSLTRFPLLPAQVRDAKADGQVALEDPFGDHFDASPTGSGPFRLGKPKSDEEGAFLPFHLRSGDRRAKIGDRGIGEVRFMVRNVVTKAPQPHVILRPEPGDWEGLVKGGYRTPRITPGKVLHFLAVNHRRPLLEIPEVRKALAHAIARETLLKEHWNPRIKDTPFEAIRASGPFEAGTWAYPPPTVFKTDPFPRGSEQLHARNAAKKVQESFKSESLTLTLLCPANDGRMREASKSIQASWKEAFAGTGVTIQFQVRQAKPDELDAALRSRDFDLAWHTLDRPEELSELWTLLDDFDAAINAPEGGNLLGYRDPALIGLIRKTLELQPFPQVQDGYHRIHTHLYEKMPFIPLWHEAPPLAVLPGLRMLDDHGVEQELMIDPRAVFQNLSRWILQ